MEANSSTTSATSACSCSKLPNPWSPPSISCPLRAKCFIRWRDPGQLHRAERMNEETLTISATSASSCSRFPNPWSPSINFGSHPHEVFHSPARFPAIAPGRTHERGNLSHLRYLCFLLFKISKSMEPSHQFRVPFAQGASFAKGMSRLCTMGPWSNSETCCHFVMVRWSDAGRFSRHVQIR